MEEFFTRWRLATALAGSVALAGGAAYMLSKLANGETAAGSKDGVPNPLVFPQFLANAQGLWLYTRQWAVAAPRAVVFLVHGLGEHVGRYEHIARKFNDVGFSVYGMDHQGHGQSDGTDKYVERFHHFIDDYTLFIDHVLKGDSSKFKSVPKFLFGHSMGGSIALHLSHTLPPGLVRGIILSAPALKADPVAAPPHLVCIAQTVSKILPKFPVADLDITTICKEHCVVERAKRDKLFSKNKLTCRLAAELHSEMEMLSRTADKVTIPYLLFTGTEDKVTLPQGSYDFHENSSSKDKTLVRYAGLAHESFNHLDQAPLIINDIVTWIENRL